MDIPPHIRPDLAERYRLLRPFDEAEVALVRALVKRPDRLPERHQVILRLALNLARLWVVSGSGGECVVGAHLGPFRDRVRTLAEALTRQRDIDPVVLGSDAEQLYPVLRAQREALLAQHLGSLMPSDLERELRQKALVLTLGGGGGGGYSHLGAFSALEAMGLRPALISGTSIGAILGAFRARDLVFRDETIRAVTHGLSFRKIFRILDSDARYAMPGAMRLYLRSALARYFVDERGEPMRMKDLAIPMICHVTGVRREAVRRLDEYEQAVKRELRRGAIGRLLHVKDLVHTMISVISELVATPGALKRIALGHDERTREFDLLDAVGFSCALPSVIQYDITRDDPRMHELVRSVLDEHGVDFLADGGLAANVPASAAWEHVQRGGIGTRNAFILAFDCFAPQIGRHVMFLPLMRLAAENVAKDRAFAHVLLPYRRTLSPANLVPPVRAVQFALERGRTEVEREGPFFQKMLEPLPSI